MKQLVVIVGCLLAFGPVVAQGKKPHAPAMSLSPYFGKAEAMKNGVWGTIKDAQGEPLPDVEAMVYHLDTILASGFTDASGHFTANPCATGKYMVKLVYPNTNKYITISGVEVKKGRVMIDIKANPPMADSSVSFAELQPKKKNDKNHPGKK